MTGGVLALGIGAVTASGCVWYVPALVDLRAGADRPVSRRLAAAGCVTGWTTSAVTTLLLVLGVPVPPVLAVVAAGAVAVVVLRIRAIVRRRAEEREDAACWAALDWAAPGRHGPSPALVAGTIGGGLGLALVTALLLLWGRDHGVGTVLAVTAPAAVAGGALLAAFAGTARPAAGPREAAVRRPGTRGAEVKALKQRS
ncbi:secreted protein [Streptomyces laurentii]|uniref:Secreted protein n=1 Tax=Streptomyces laurentii TaxID=39478 RepID=A0A169PDS8_STRLU|nr:secreted protein [Streptomyces laurentii]